MMKRALARALTIGAATTTLLLGMVLFAHTSTGRPIALGLTRMAHGGCPFGYDKAMSPAEREHARSNFAASHRGEQRAANRPALGFTLDQTTRKQVVASMTAHGVRCAQGMGISDLSCTQVPSAALPGSAPAAPPRTVWFTFGLKDQLLAVIAVSKDARPEPISEAFLSTRRSLDEHAGAVATLQGEADSKSLAKGLLREASAEFRFSNYYALERAANMGNGFVLTEEYRSL
ncbi:MAG: hypothetical protein ABI488_07355 [Polyangiaceae bacterium]